MSDEKILAGRFEADRGRLRRVAYRMLGSSSEAEDAVQEAWLRLSRADTSGVDNLSGWLTTVVARVCLDMLRSRRSRREEPLDQPAAETLAERADPEQELATADSLGVALLVVLETLPPPERVAFVLHDMFDLPFEEIAPIVGRSTDAARQLASRARRRVKGGSAGFEPSRERHRSVVEAYLRASRSGDLAALLAVLDPQVVLRADASAVPAGMALQSSGAEIVARRALVGFMPEAELALVDGEAAVVVLRDGAPFRVLRFTVNGDRVTEIEVLADADRLAGLEIT
ncbi:MULTISPECIES: sigma-70 family RNA polymerase sigma factor [unclassified Devosia]|uniref:sigma-70 family RNA polymerase sigma factor n=1 Tax=unclassified Devosia TaxID=196773 RepID=UPI00086B3091|nr:MULTISPECIES: sigma-70 family RNA polymerase sigma factor [unclassified Devosia]MBN9362120.1 sigma-70 family RNA polymerase sigma factor [Devosia sp.]ODS87163.1 MAG: RNA polymerase subunit sigma-70 [Devosia sp. SCN 66-27]OJX24615.1 MAG: RNA polymerase subunit sigma-70 [Devosia sp. 66-14]